MESRYSEVLGTMKIALLYRVFCYVGEKRNKET